MATTAESSSARLTRLGWNLSAAELRDVGGSMIQSCAERLGALLARPDAPVVPVFLTQLDRILLEVRDVGAHGGFLFNVHPEAEVRSAGRELSEASDRFFNAFRLNARAYELLGAIQLQGIDPLTRYTIEKMVKEMRRSGVEKDPKVRAQLQHLSDNIDSICNEFAQNIATQHRGIEVSGAEELEGLPVDFIKSHPPGPAGQLRITTTYPDYVPIMSYADRPDVRRRLNQEFMNRAFPENLPVLRGLLQKRHEFASMLGYPAFSDLAMDDKMMETPERAQKFLKEVAIILRKGSDADYRYILARKMKEQTGSSTLDPWDDAYYRNKIQSEEYGVDARTLRAYLPYGPVRDGLFHLCGGLFGLEFRATGSVEVWHPTVEAYEVSKDGQPIGRFFLDMVPRDGKFSHAACFGIRTGILDVQLPQAALVCNFVDPQVSKEVARMEYRDVITFFHEFGHLLHSMLSGQLPWTYAHQLEWDFVEAPSQLFEEWARDPPTLSRFAKDPDTGATIPQDILGRLEKSDAFGRPSKCMRQVALSAISLAYYNENPLNLETTERYHSIWSEHLPGHLPPEYHPEAAWGHLTGYSACYYTYVWSLVIARDLLTPFRSKGNLTDPGLARRYAEEILAPGGSRPASESIQAFLGRAFDLKAFEDWANAGQGSYRPQS
jgi:thimet oligopeptidase